MITIDRKGLNTSLSDSELNQLQLNFQKKHFVRFPNIISQDLLEDIYSQMMTAEWEDRIHHGIGIEVCLADPGIVALLNFLFNDQEFFRLIQKITGCGFIGCFQGRVYRLIAGAGHYDSWHTDFGDDRLLALSLNLGKEPCTGGVLEIQSHQSEGPPIDVPNPNFGHAVLFRLSDQLKHRVTNVVGKISKTAFAGWFKSTPDLWSTLNELAQSSKPQPVP
jgi:hypothetical protein